MIYPETYTPRISDYDRTGKLSYEAILQILETAGSHHSDRVGDRVIDGSMSGIAWILTDWRIKILRRTDSKEELHIATWVHGKAPASTVYRDFILRDASSAEVIRAEAKFALVDLKTGRLTRISEELFASYQPEEASVFDIPAPRLRAPAGFNAEHPVTLRRSDIDFNGHVHNTRYIDFCLDLLPQALYQKNDFKDIHIVYSKPITESDSVCVQYTPQENAHIFSVYTDGTLCTLLEFR